MIETGVLNAKVTKLTPKGAIMSGLISLTSREIEMVLELIKSGKLTSIELSEKLRINGQVTACIADLLMEKSCLRGIIESRGKKYQVSLARKKLLKLPFDIWGSLEKKLSWGRFYAA